jgi:LuxR family transcriptional regulator, maltose regulon positive regulatory protein
MTQTVQQFAPDTLPVVVATRPSPAALVRSLAVPRILAGEAADIVELVVTQPEFGESEPLLLAAAALARNWLDITESALARANAELDQLADPPVTHTLSAAMITVALARLQDHGAAGLEYASEARQLMIKLTAAERAQAPELPGLIDYYAAGFELCDGNLSVARWTLERAAGRFRQWLVADTDDAERRVRADCAGQLSWLDAFCGELQRATRYASCLLTDRRADTSESGARFAQLATAWTHLEHAEFEQARQRLDHALSTASDVADPLLAAAERLTQARLAVLTGDPETALRLLRPPPEVGGLATSSRWFADHVRIAIAEAWLAAGEIEQAMATLEPEPELAVADARLVMVKALRLAGRFRAATELLARIPSDPVEISLSTSVRLWLLQAEVAAEQGHYDRADMLVDRALRTATKEQLRSTVASAGRWLRSFVAQEPGLSRRYSAFLASAPVLPSPAVHPGSGPGPVDSSAVCIVPLTRRETQVLQRLAEFCSNEEIAAELVVSLNTVKTHMRSLFQKLTVTRRADAVRQGRALGLC